MSSTGTTEPSSAPDPFLAAGREMMKGLLPTKAEKDFVRMPSGLFDGLTKLFMESMASEERFEWFFSDDPKRMEGPVIPFSPERQNWSGRVVTGRNCKSRPKNAITANWGTIFDNGFDHKVGKKDGWWLSPIGLHSLKRGNDHVKSIEFGVFDEDTGLTTHEIIERFVALGISVTIATTHSHMKESTTVSAKKYDELAAQGLSPDKILHRLKGYLPRVCEGASAGERGTREKTTEQIIHHKPCPRHRIALPYIRPILSSAYTDQLAFIAAHKVRYDAIAKYLEMPNYDKACADPAHIFYWARHTKGHPYFTIELPGAVLDPFCEEIESIIEKTRGESAAKSEKPKQSSAEPRPTVGIGEFNYTRWAALFGKHFLIVDALSARHPDAFFNGFDASKAWHPIECPTDAHEQNGGTHVCNPTGEKGFAIDCKHATCAAEPTNNDRLIFIEEMVKNEWLSPADLTMREYFCGSDQEYAEAFAKLHPQRWPEGYREKDGQIFWVTKSESKAPDRLEYVCDSFRVVGESRNELGEDWSIQVEYRTSLGAQRVAIPMKQLQVNSGAVRELLVSKGLRIMASPWAKGKFDALISMLSADKTILITTRAGFHEHDGSTVFVSPCGNAIDEAGDRPDVQLGADQCMKDPKPKGTLSGRDDIMEAVVESGNHHWLLGVLSGFAGTLVALLEMDTCGLGFSGPSSRGKSTLQKLGAAVFGNPQSGMGLLHTMRTTSNAIENLAARSHGTTLQLDELAQLPPKELSNFIFGLTGGVGKSRQRADSSLRPVAKWSTFVTTSSERGFAQLMESADQRLLTGHVARIPDVNVSDMKTVSPELMARIEACKHNYGHAGPVFVRRLFKDGYVRDPDRLRGEVEALISRLAGSSADGAVRRAAIPFALLWRSGEIALSASLLPAAADVAGAVLWAWESYRQGSEAEALDPMTRAIKTIQSALLTGWNVDIVSVGKKDDDLRYRAVRWGWYDDHCLYILRPKLSELAGATDKPQAIAKALHDGEYLIKNGQKFHHIHLPGIGPSDHYRLKRKLFLPEEPT